jgi:hypothetical protein
MRALSNILFASLIAGALSAPVAAAPPPPPPPAPAELPTELHGYDTQQLWTNYSLWVDQRVGEARAMALETNPPATWLGDTNPEHGWWRAQGLRVRIYSNEWGGGAYGADISIDRWCRGEACVWAARRATNTGDRAAFVRDNFNLDLAVQYLIARGVPASQVPRYRPQSYGLPDPAAYAVFLNFVDLAQVTEHECPGVRNSVRIAEERADELVIRKRGPEGARMSDPPWPHSALYEITIPGWDARRSGDARSPGMSVAVRFVGFANHAVADLVRAVIAPLQNCGALN